MVIYSHLKFKAIYSAAHTDHDVSRQVKLFTVRNEWEMYIAVVVRCINLHYYSVCGLFQYIDSEAMKHFQFPARAWIGPNTQGNALAKSCNFQRFLMKSIDVVSEETCDLQCFNSNPILDYLNLDLSNIPVKSICRNVWLFTLTVSITYLSESLFGATRWNRICRPGSILGPQQQFLCDMQQDMWQAGMGQRKTSTLIAFHIKTIGHDIPSQLRCNCFRATLW